MNNSFWTGGVNLHPVNFGGVTAPSLYPASPFYLTLGTQYNYIAGAYVHHHWSSIYDTWPSDARLKTNVENLSNGISNIQKLRAVKFDIIPSIYDSVQGPMRDVVLADSKDKLGFIAQEIKEVFPNIVHVEPTTGYYGISTMDLIPVLVVGIQEQQLLIDSLFKKINELEMNYKQKSVINIYNSKEPISSLYNNNNLAKLEQNSPNPFNQNTEIRYTVPSDFKSAFINIYNLNGLQIHSYQITNSGDGKIIINGNDLIPGIYLYTLIVDNREMQTLKMILTEK